MKSDLRNAIDKLLDTKPIENIGHICGAEFLFAIQELIKEASRADKELDVVHKCITALYEKDANVPKIKSTLREIERIS